MLVSSSNKSTRKCPFLVAIIVIEHVDVAVVDCGASVVAIVA